MARKRDSTEAEFLRGIVRKLKSENRHLRKQIGMMSKRAIHVDLVLESNEEEEVSNSFVEVKDSCPECSSDLIIMDLGVRSLKVCKNCSYRKSLPKRKK